MSAMEKTMSETRELHASASNALHQGEFQLAESLSKVAISKLTSVLDPIHLLYIELLKGLHSSLIGQDKFDEAGTTSLLIAQLCNGQ